MNSLNRQPYPDSVIRAYEIAQERISIQEQRRLAGALKVSLGAHALCLVFSAAVAYNLETTQNHLSTIDRVPVYGIAALNSVFFLANLASLLTHFSSRKRDEVELANKERTFAQYYPGVDIDQA